MSAPMDQLMADSDSPSQKDIQLARQHQQMDEELLILEREASQLQRSLEEGARNHIREMKKIKEQRLSHHFTFFMSVLDPTFQSGLARKTNRTYP